MKYGIWNVSSYDPVQHRALCLAGYSPLTAAVLCSRGYSSVPEARAYLDVESPLCDPLAMRDMDKAAHRVRLALQRGEKIAVFGDYDVDGITATCLLTHFLRSRGGSVVPYIPARMEEGYGLNEMAIETLKQEGVELIVTVDCGITADAEALLCRSLGIDLVITDHHECKDTLPQAAAVVDPHRRDCTYPHQLLAGVGVAFKLAAAVCGDQEAVLDAYCDLVCLGTVADVMPLQGENRTIVARGLEKMTRQPSLALQALMAECGCQGQPVTAGLIGYTLAPRINAAGRMGQVPVALELFLTRDSQTAAAMAAELCKMNRQRQSVETEIYQDAVSRLGTMVEDYGIIVLSGEDWHQGVVGIVASRLAEEYSCPTFLVCMDGDKGKASSRSYGGFNLFAALEELSELLESYGGHELAAGFTIRRDKIDLFRERMKELAGQFARSGQCRTALEIDCEIGPELLSLKHVDALDELEPSGAGCPRPVFYMSRVRVDQLSSVGGGKHLRLKLSKNGKTLGGIFFSVTALGASVAEGDLVEIAFQPQINEFRGNRSVQLNLVDIRQDSAFRLQSQQDEDIYARLSARLPVEDEELSSALPRRQEFVSLWKYLTANADDDTVEESLECLARKAARNASLPISVLRTHICLDVFEELGLIAVEHHPKSIRIRLSQSHCKVDLESSRILKHLKATQAGEPIHG